MYDDCIKKVRTFGKPSLKMLTKLKLSSEEIAKVDYERYYYPCPIVQKRLHAIFFKATTNLTNKQICFLAGAHQNSVRHWTAIYQGKGIVGLCTITYRRNQSLLENEAVSIKELFEKNHPAVSLKQG